MKIHMRFDASNAEHTRITLFINGANCGQLCVRTDDAVHLHMVLAYGLNMPEDEFVSSGRVWGAEDFVGDGNNSEKAAL